MGHHSYETAQSYPDASRAYPDAYKVLVQSLRMKGISVLSFSETPKDDYLRATLTVGLPGGKRENRVYAGYIEEGVFEYHTCRISPCEPVRSLPVSQ